MAGTHSSKGYIQAGVDLSTLANTISPHEMRSTTRDRSEDIFEDWESLVKIMNGHAATIQKRWVKKTNGQRKQILLGAWPSMATSHRPDIAAWRHSSFIVTSYPWPDGLSSSQVREAYLWPSINLEDLAKPKSLLIFLDSRARNHPDAFALADNNAARFGYSVAEVICHTLQRHTMMFTGRKNVESYGELICWDECSEAEGWLLSGKGVTPGDGWWILVMQQRIMSFLVDCCRKILHDIPENALLGGGQQLQSAPIFAAETVGGFAMRAVLASERPYRPPAQLDLAMLEAVVAARVSFAEDHLFSLREDPSYFEATIREYREHEPMMIARQRYSKECPHITGHDTWRNAIDKMLTDSYLNLMSWTLLERQLQEARELHEKHVQDIKIEEDLPSGYLDALLELRLDDPIFGKWFTQSYALQRTPPLQEPEQDLAVPVRGPPSKKSLSKLYHELELCAEIKPARYNAEKTAHQKVKTRGLPTPITSMPTASNTMSDIETSPATTTATTATAVEPPRTFEVDARALRVFRHLFYTPSLDATQGEIAWTDFLHAMCSLNFAPEKLYGSVWSLAPTDPGMPKSINVHEPHPDGKLRYLQARKIGRRLNRIYGWTAETFTLKAKVSASR